MKCKRLDIEVVVEQIFFVTTTSIFVGGAFQRGGSFDVAGVSVLLVNVDGEYYAIGNKCTHRGCKLSKGALDGETVKCPCHKSVFNMKTGEVVHRPASKPEPKYTVKVEE